jgi:hypothetical protein
MRRIIPHGIVRLGADANLEEVGVGRRLKLECKSPKKRQHLDPEMLIGGLTH